MEDSILTPTSMPDINGGYDKPEYSGSTRFGRNKQLTDDFTLLKQAHEATARSRKSAKDGPLRPSIGNGTDPQTKTPIPFSV